MSSRNMVRCLRLAALAATAVACSTPDPKTEEEKTARGNELVRKMSDTLRSAQTFSFTVNESHERVRRNGEKQSYTLKRDVVVRRPNSLWSHATRSDEGDIKLTYDGSTLTVVSDKHKIYATIKAPATLDETLDLISERFDLRVSVADFLYSTPRESFDESQRTGGWVRRTNVEGKSCEEMSYVFKAVDVTLSVTSAEPTVPCEARITFKEEPQKPVTRLVFGNWNLKAQPAEAQFAANVPQGYELIPIVERIPKAELKADAAKAMSAAPPAK